MSTDLAPAPEMVQCFNIKLFPDRKYLYTEIPVGDTLSMMAKIGKSDELPAGLVKLMKDFAAKEGNDRSRQGVILGL
jgi:hypothetical protein